jgi:hypothetical protein
MTRSRCPRPDRWGIVLKRFVVSMLLALCLVVPSVGHSQSGDPRVGSWRLVQMIVDSRDQPAGNSTWVYSQEGAGLRVDVHSVTPTGRTQHWSYQTKRDGVEVRVLGNPAIDRVAVTRRNDWLDEIVYKKAGVVTTTGTSEISADGQTMTVALQGLLGRRGRGVYKKAK